MYPSKFPEGGTISLVALIDFNDPGYEYSSEYKDISFPSNGEKKCNVTVHTHPDFEYMTEDKVFEEINGYECWFSQSDRRQCAFKFEDYTYVVLAPTYDDVVLIVSNMKKYEKED